MTLEEKAGKLIEYAVLAMVRDWHLDMMLYGRHPWPPDKRSPADPRNPKETTEP